MSWGVLGCVFLESMGANCGVCTATNHLIQQIEAPPEQHWQRAADRMRLTPVQLQQLAAGYEIFVQHKKIQQKLQLAVAQLVSSPNSCGVQLLAAAKQASSTPPSSSSSTWEMATQWQPPAADLAAGAAAAAAASGKTDSQPEVTGTHTYVSAADEDGTCHCCREMCQHQEPLPLLLPPLLAWRAELPASCQWLVRSLASRQQEQQLQRWWQRAQLQTRSLQKRRTNLLR